MTKVFNFRITTKKQNRNFSLLYFFPSIILKLARLTIIPTRSNFLPNKNSKLNIKAFLLLRIIVNRYTVIASLRI